MDNSQSPPANPRPIIGLITYSALPDLHEGDWPLRDALLTRGFRVTALVWDDPAVDWSSLDLCVIRVPVVPTVWLDRGTAVDLSDLMRERSWPKAVVKPSVSASAHATILVTPETLVDGQAHLDALLAREDAMVQPFIASVETYRERSLLFADGELTHAVSRPPQLRTEGPPEGHNGHGEYSLVTPTADELSLAKQALTAAGFDTLYARVDIVLGDDGEPCLIELELVEPSLFLDLSPLATTRVAEAIATRTIY